MDVLPRLHAEIERGERERFGFAFIDADKLNNWNYFDWAVRMSVGGGCVVVDNIVSKGRLAMGEEEAGRNEMVRGARECVERVGRDGRVEATVLQTVGEKDYDGYVFSFFFLFSLFLGGMVVMLTGVVGFCWLLSSRPGRILKEDWRVGMGVLLCCYDR